MSEQIRTSGISTLEALAKEISERYQKKTDMPKYLIKKRINCNRWIRSNLSAVSRWYCSWRTD